MARKLALDIPQPCHEDWNSMNPDEKGRFCLSCQKTVTDFTQMSDRQIAEYFKNYKGSTCGRFTADQINRNYEIPRKPIPFIKYVVRAAVASIFLFFKTPANAQGEVRKATEKIAYKVDTVKIYGDVKGEIVETISCSPKTGLESSAPLNRTAGSVRDTSGTPIPSAVVTPANDTPKFANELGKFLLHNVRYPNTITIEALGYETKTLVVNRPGALNVTLQPSDEQFRIMLGFVVPTYVQKNAPVRNIEDSSNISEKEPGLDWMLFPNPTIPGGALILRSDSLNAGQYAAEILTTSGQLMNSQMLESKRKKLVLHLPMIRPSTYILRLTEIKTGKVYSKQFIVQ